MTGVSSSKLKERIVTHVVMPDGVLNDRAAEATSESGSSRSDYHTATFANIITEAELNQELAVSRKPKVRHPPLKALVK